MRPRKSCPGGAHFPAALQVVMLSGMSAFMCHCAIHVLSGLGAREQLCPLRDHWADTGHRVRCYGGRSAPTPSLVCHFVLDAPLRMTIDSCLDAMSVSVSRNCIQRLKENRRATDRADPAASNRGDLHRPRPVVARGGAVGFPCRIS